MHEILDYTLGKSLCAGSMSEIEFNVVSYSCILSAMQRSKL